MTIDPERIEIASLSDVGRQRANNQDAYGEGRTRAGARWMMVADGMGGHAAGETASRIAVETMSSQVTGAESASDAVLGAAIESANRAIYDEAERDRALAGMGTTGVAVLFGGDGAWVANVGDSRAYRLRDERFEQITHDHSLVAEMQRRGMLTEAEALVHPRRNELLRSLGVERDVMVDLHALDLAPGDLILLCSDGLSGVLRDPEIAEVLRREPPAQAVRTLVELANRRGGPDNVTVQIARIPATPAADSGPSSALLLALVGGGVVAALVAWRMIS